MRLTCSFCFLTLWHFVHERKSRHRSTSGRGKEEEPSQKPGSQEASDPFFDSCRTTWKVVQTPPALHYIFKPSRLPLSLLLRVTDTYCTRYWYLIVLVSHQNCSFNLRSQIRWPAPDVQLPPTHQPAHTAYPAVHARLTMMSRKRSPASRDKSASSLLKCRDCKMRSRSCRLPLPVEPTIRADFQRGGLVN